MENQVVDLGQPLIPHQKIMKNLIGTEISV